MNEKVDRKWLVASLINSRKLHTQEEILEALEEKGVAATQATLSRDIKELGAHKVSSPDGEVYYRIPSSTVIGQHDFLTGVEVSGQLCIAHSKPGFAPAVASLIDAAHIEGIMGTIAGDDTVLIVFKVDAVASKMLERIKALM